MGLNSTPRTMPFAEAATLVALFVALVAASGCDTSFEVFAETDAPYSVFGILDANADAQYLRIEPLQDSMLVGGEGVAARVTTENVATGETVVWTDSAFSIGVGDRPVRNATTAARFAPGATYRLRVERPQGGSASTAEVTLPPAFPPFELLRAPGSLNNPPIVRVEGAEHLGAVRAAIDYDLCVPLNCIRQQTTTFHLSDTVRTGPEAWSVRLDWPRQVLEGLGDQYSIGAIHDFSVSVAAVSEDWPGNANPIPGPNEPSLPQAPGGGASNVENGVGFVGGAFTRTVRPSLE